MTAKPRARARSLVPLLLSVAVIVYLLDRATKTWALTLEPGVPHDVIGSLLRFRLVFNPGAAFSFGTNATWVFTIVMTLVSVAILWYAVRLTSRWWAVCLGLVLGGATGNLTDRLTRPPAFGWGHVVDFIELPNFPIFNVADSAVVTGAALIALASFKGIEAVTTSTSPSRRDGTQVSERGGAVHSTEEGEAERHA